MPKTVDYENLEQNILGSFRENLVRFGYNPDDIEGLQKIRHNAFETVLIMIYENLFKPDGRQESNSFTLLPYDYNDNNIYILNTLVSVYLKLCNICGKSTGVMGFASFTGYSLFTLRAWRGDKLNPARSVSLEKIYKTNQHVLTNRLQDTPLGSVAVANNDEDTGLKWSANNQQNITKNTVFVLPGERVKDSLQGPELKQISKE